MRLKFGKESKKVKLSSACELVRRKPVSDSKMKNVISFWRLMISFGEMGSRVANHPMFSTLTLWQKDMKDLDFDTILRMLRAHISLTSLN